MQRMTQLEAHVEENKVRTRAFTEQLAERIGANDVIAQDGEHGDVVVSVSDWDDPAYDPEFEKEFGRMINDPSIKEADHKFTRNSYDDTYLNMELALPRNGGDEVQFGRVV